MSTPKKKRAPKVAPEPAMSVASLAAAAATALEAAAVARYVASLVQSCFLPLGTRQPPCVLVRPGEGAHAVTVDALAEVEHELDTIVKRFLDRARTNLGATVAGEATRAARADATHADLALPTFDVVESR